LKRTLFLLALALALTACGPAGSSDAVERGDELYHQALIGGVAPGCFTCHSTDQGVVKVGPSHASIAERAEEIIKSPDYPGEATSAAVFLRESILDPNVYIEPGFQPGVMYQNYGEVLGEKQVDDLVAYLMSLR
jgi:mono/diheme cytochrome c family protein